MPFQYRLCVERIYEEGEDILEGEGTQVGYWNQFLEGIVYASISSITTF